MDSLIRALPAAVWWLYVGSFTNRVRHFLSLPDPLPGRPGFSPSKAGLAAAAYGVAASRLQSWAGSWPIA
jgi:hypothetical protein